MTSIRRIKNAKLKNVPLSENDKYIFSSSYSLSIYPIDAVYTFIPKNACSTLRYSVAVANGFIDNLSEIDWIHSNNQTFISTQRELAKAKYTFIILRCPYTRVASCFLDLIVSGDLSFNDSNNQKLSINFYEFLLLIKSQSREERNIHWRNQSDFLHYEKYDDYFSLELFSDAILSLQKKELKVFDTRSVINHDLSNLERINGDFAKTKDLELRQIKIDGFAPHYKSMFGNSEIELVREIYNDDIELYKCHFGDKNLLF